MKILKTRKLVYRDFFDSPDAEDAKRFNHLQRQVRFKSQKFIKLNIFYQDKPLAAGCAWVHSPTSSASLYSPWGNLGDILSGQFKFYFILRLWQMGEAWSVNFKQKFLICFTNIWQTSKDTFMILTNWPSIVFYF